MKLLIHLAAAVLSLAVASGTASAAFEADSLTTDWSLVDEYRIVPGDMVVVNFGPQELSATDLRRSARVRPDGRISVYPVGEVVAAGRTPRELEQALVSLLAVEVRNPRVTVEIAEFGGNQIHVLGRVENPGSFPIGPFTTVLQAIALSGGFKDDAARNSVIVFHRDGAKTVRVVRVRVDQVLKAGKVSQDMVLSRFDIVYVPRSSIGNLNVFTKQFFAEFQPVVTTALLGWELFHLDRVFLVGAR